MNEKRKIDIEVVSDGVDNAVSTQGNLEEAPPPLPKKKRTWLSNLFLTVICAVSIVIIIQLATSFHGQVKPFNELLAGTDWTYFAIAIAVLVLMIALDSLKFAIMLKITTGKLMFKNSIKTSLLGKYYDCITPLATGGQPMQIYYLHKKGVSTGSASAVVFARYVFQIFAWLLVALLLFIFQSNVLSGFDKTTATVLKIGGWVGWALTALAPIGLVGCSLMPKFLTGVLNFFVKIGKKLRLVKDVEATKGKILKGIEDYQSGFALVSKKPLAVVVLIFVSFFEPIVSLAFPYFVLLAFAGDVVTPGLETLLTVMALHVFALYSTAIIPTPGNAGFVETAFTFAFQYIAGAVLFWVVFSWRFLTYYIYILIGIGISIFEIIRNAVRARRSRTNNN